MLGKQAKHYIFSPVDYLPYPIASSKLMISLQSKPPLSHYDLSNRDGTMFFSFHIIKYKVEKNRKKSFLISSSFVRNFVIQKHLNGRSQMHRISNKKYKCDQNLGYLEIQKRRLSQ